MLGWRRRIELELLSLHEFIAFCETNPSNRLSLDLRLFIYLLYLRVVGPFIHTLCAFKLVLFENVYDNRDDVAHKTCAGENNHDPANLIFLLGVNYPHSCHWHQHVENQNCHCLIDHFLSLHARGVEHSDVHDKHHVEEL